MVKITGLRFNLSKRVLFEISVLVAILVAGVWYVFWHLPEKYDSQVLCETCPVTECNIYTSLTQAQGYPSPIIKLGNQKNGERYQIGDILVDNSRAVIEFPGSVGNNAAPSVQFIASPQIQDIPIKSLVIAEVKLVDLQNAIALVDWKHLEQLRTTNDAPLELLIQWKENSSTIRLKAAEVVKDLPLKLGNLLFMGTELQWQELAIAQPGLPSACPLVFSPSGLPPALYEVSPAILPPPGTKVTLILRVSRN